MAASDPKDAVTRSLFDHVYSADNGEACQVRFYVGSGSAVATHRESQIGGFGASAENALGKMCLHSNCPGCGCSRPGRDNRKE